MNKLATHYKKLLEKCYELRDKYGETDLGLFSAGVGSLYNHRLIVVGRATNSWGNDFDKHTRADYDDLINNYLPRLSSETLDWLKGDTNGWKESSSAFWRVARKLARAMANNSDDSVDYIGYSNLYKVSGDGRNPSGPLMDVEFDECVAILKGEIEILEPANVVFLTGLEWAVPFLDRLGIMDQSKTSTFSYVKFGARTNNRNYVVCTHPQGKPELSQYEEILETLNYLNNGEEGR